MNINMSKSFPCFSCIEETGQNIAFCQAFPFSAWKTSTMFVLQYTTSPNDMDTAYPRTTFVIKAFVVDPSLQALQNPFHSFKIRKFSSKKHGFHSARTFSTRVTTLSSSLKSLPRLPLFFLRAYEIFIGIKQDLINPFLIKTLVRVSSVKHSFPGIRSLSNRLQTILEDGACFTKVPSAQDSHARFLLNKVFPNRNSPQF